MWLLLRKYKKKKQEKRKARSEKEYTVDAFSQAIISVVTNDAKSVSALNIQSLSLSAKSIYKTSDALFLALGSNFFSKPIFGLALENREVIQCNTLLLYTVVRLTLSLSFSLCAHLIYASEANISMQNFLFVFYLCRGNCLPLLIAERPVREVPAV